MEQLCSLNTQIAAMGTVISSHAYLILFYDLFPYNVSISCFVVVAVAGFLLSLWFFISNIDGTDVYLMLRYRGDVILKRLPVYKISESNKYL